jgi:glyoxylase-like metal-dependent hydrolase (beta-lactamase superfamily II)
MLSDNLCYYVYQGSDL